MNINTTNNLASINSVQNTTGQASRPSKPSKTGDTPTDSINFSQSAKNIARAETMSAAKTESPQKNISNISNSIQQNPELALTAQSTQISASAVQSLLG